MNHGAGQVTVLVYCSYLLCHLLTSRVPGPRSGGAGLFEKGGSLARLAAPGHYRWLFNPGHQACLLFQIQLESADDLSRENRFSYGTQVL